MLTATDWKILNILKRVFQLMKSEEDSTLKKSTVYRRIAFMKKEGIIKDDKKN